MEIREAEDHFDFLFTLYDFFDSASLAFNLILPLELPPWRGPAYDHFHISSSRRHFVTRATIQSINKYKRVRAPAGGCQRNVRAGSRPGIKNIYCIPYARARVVTRRTFNLQKAQCRTSRAIVSMIHISRQMRPPAFRRVVFCNLHCYLFALQ